jgi:hypothetical protein
VQAFAANGRSKFAKLSENPSYPRTLYCFDVNESEFEPIRRLTKLGLHTAVLGHEETRCNQDFCQAKENVAETCFATTPTKLELRTYHGLTCTSHMDGLGGQP